MHIQHKLSGTKGMFYVPGEETVAAELIYSIQQPDKMIVEHTEVTDELRGQNIGYELVHAAVEHARTHNMKIVPVCPFTKSVIDKKPDFQDVLV